MNEAPEQKFGRYEIRSELGSGAMGIVYLGFDPEIGREVAVKTIKHTLDLPPSKRKEYLERFRREAQAAGRLSGHPNIVPVFDVGQQGELPYIVMAYVESESLDRARRRRKLDEAAVRGVAADVCMALAHAHRNGIIHRDVKPANILMTPTSAVLTDFGIARLDESELTRAGTFLGSPSYMSPEQVRGVAIDGRSDLFSLAVILYLLLTGEKPFAADDTNGILYKIVNVEAGPPSQFSPKLAKWDGFFARALVKEPDERFPNAEALLQALALVGADAGPQAHAAASAATVATVPTAPEPVSAAPVRVEVGRQKARTPEPDRHNPFADRSVFFNMDMKSQVSTRRSSSTTGSGRVERLLRGKSGPRRRSWEEADSPPFAFWVTLVAITALLGALVFAFWPAGTTPGPEQPAPSAAHPTTKGTP